MKRKLTVWTLLVSFLLLASFAHAQEADNAANEDGAGLAAIANTIKSRLQASRSGLGIESIDVSPIKGLYAVQITNGPVLYATKNGEYFVLGDLFQVAATGFVNLAETAREGDRAVAMSQIKIEDMIVFSPENTPVKTSVLVFTDVDCFYCQKLHKEVPDLNRMGIEVRYLAYPRAGIGSDSYNKIASAWCASDKKSAMNKLKNRQRIPINVCPNNPVAAQFKLGQKVGVTGTPALVSESGQLMPGYMPALQLAAALGVEVDPVLAAEIEKKQAARGN